MLSSILITLGLIFGGGPVPTDDFTEDSDVALFAMAAGESALGPDSVRVFECYEDGSCFAGAVDGDTELSVGIEYDAETHSTTPLTVFQP